MCLLIDGEMKWFCYLARRSYQWSVIWDASPGMISNSRAGPQCIVGHLHRTDTLSRVKMVWEDWPSGSEGGLLYLGQNYGFFCFSSSGNGSLISLPSLSISSFILVFEQFLWKGCFISRFLSCFNQQSQWKYWLFLFLPMQFHWSPTISKLA